MDSKYGKYIVTALHTPLAYTAEHEAEYAKWATRILWMDADIVPGAFQMNCAWYLKPPAEETERSVPHVHACDEIIGFFSGDSSRPHDLGAEVEFWLEDEMHLIKQSALIFIPAGMRHCPLILRRVDRPVFHLSVLTASHYNYTESDK